MNDLKILQAMLLLAETLSYSSSYTLQLRTLIAEMYANHNNKL